MRGLAGRFPFRSNSARIHINQRRRCDAVRLALIRYRSGAGQFSTAPGTDNSGQPRCKERAWIEEEDHTHSDEVTRRRFIIKQSESAEMPQSTEFEYQIDVSSHKIGNGREFRGWQGPWKVTRWFSGFFLPVGFPHSVRSPDYGGFYSWLFLQNVAGSTSYIMSMEALLHAVGVSSSALGWAAAASWVLKDGLGSVGMIFSAKILGDNNKFDADTLRAKWRADVAHNLGVSFELMTLVFPTLFLPLASLANTLKGIAGLTNGACRASINRHLATQNNLGDVTAKGQAQGLAAYLTGLGLGVGLDSMIPALTSLCHVIAPNVDLPRAVALWVAFACLAVIHICCSYMALRSIAMRSLNAERASILFDQFLQPHIGALASQFGSAEQYSLPDPRFMTPLELRDSKLQNIIQQGPYLRRQPVIIMGSSVLDAFPSACDAETAIEAASDQKFLLAATSGKIHVVLHSSSSSADVLEAFFCAFAFQCVLNHSEQGGSPSWTAMIPILRRVFPRVRDRLTETGWNMNEILLAPNKLKYTAVWQLGAQSSISEYKRP